MTFHVAENHLLLQSFRGSTGCVEETVKSALTVTLENEPLILKLILPSLFCSIFLSFKRGKTVLQKISFKAM